MSGYEFLSSEGYRLDGRRPHEIRKISCSIGVAPDADGSAYLEQGNTKVIAKVWGPREPTKLSKAREAGLEERCYVSCQYSMSHYSTSERRERTSGDRRTADISQHLQQVFNAVILTELYPRSQIDIYVEVLQADGSGESVSINACSLALISAGIPCRECVVACSASYLHDVPSGTVTGSGTPRGTMTESGTMTGSGTETGAVLLDVNHQEEAAPGTAHLSLAMLPKSRQIVLLEITSRVHEDNLRALLQHVTRACCKDLHAVLDRYVKGYVAEASGSAAHDT